ncbi:MAG: DUF4386 family protein [Aquincola sp.]|nr:DUF4386 family protein [Aquincola sp.]
MTFMLRSGAHNNNVALTFFGCYCLLLGFLVVEAKFLPRVLGLVLSLAGLTWLVRSVGLFLAPALVRDIADILMAAAGIGELLFTLWLLFFGVNSAKWHAQAEGA